MKVKSYDGMTPTVAVSLFFDSHRLLIKYQQFTVNQKAQTLPKGSYLLNSLCSQVARDY